MLKRAILIYKILVIHLSYLHSALREIYLYYESPYPLYILMKKFSLANRKIKVTLLSNNRGRPQLDQKIVELILELKKLNPTWGAQRIVDELKKIGRKVSKQTVLNYLEIYGLRTPPPHNGLTWNEFLSSHKFKIGIDFTSKISIWGDQIFIFVILNLDTREILHIAPTFNPCSIWIKQQFKNAFYDLDEYPTLCLCDRDQIFARWFTVMMKDFFDIKVVHTPIKTPELNGKVERCHRSIKEEGLVNVIPITIPQTLTACGLYKDYYNKYRPHQGIDGKIPLRSDDMSTTNLFFERKKHLAGRITTFGPMAA
ncbi:integrase core domain-containing protein [bacterium]|nr:integrase core domain-containing protein [bacterium]